MWSKAIFHKACQTKFGCYPWIREEVQPKHQRGDSLEWRGHETGHNVRPKTRNSHALNKRLPTDRTLLSGFHAVFKGESSMTTVLPSPLPARRAPLAADSLPASEKPNLPQSPPTIPTPSTRHQFPPVVSPRKEPPTSSVQIPRLQSEPTEPPKQTLNGRNQPLNGAVHFSPRGAGPRPALFGIVLHFITFHHFFALFPQGGNRQTTIP